MAAPAGHRRHHAVAAATALDVVGAAVASRLGLVGEPLRITAPAWIPRPVVLVGFGSALSGPLAVDAALLRLAMVSGEGNAAPSRWIGRFGWLRLAGVLAEPVTWGRRRPSWTMLLAGAQLATSVALIF